MAKFNKVQVYEIAKDVIIDDIFWSPRIRTNRENTIPHVYRKLKENGCIDAFKLDWKPGKEPVPHRFWDSDVAKWIEAVSLSVATKPKTALDALLDEVVKLVISAQQADGYLNVHFTVVEPEKRWTNLRDGHELYCAGHLMEAAVAHYQATGKRNFLDAMCRYADYIDKVFGTAPDKKRGYCGHEEIELALVKLYRVTDNKKYLELSQYFIDERGRQPHYFDIEAKVRGEDQNENFWGKNYEYTQSHIPVREQSKAVGHAVRAMYLYSAMADLGYELGDETLLYACRRLWKNLCTKRIYITGGIGSLSSNEGFTEDYDLPNETAYAETCAAIGLVFWNHRMLQIYCDGKYADVMERALYNGLLSGISLDGKKFFYDNPLASLGKHHRQEWFGCACCPTNIARLVASIGQFIYSHSQTDVAVHLYIQGSVRLSLGGEQVILRQETRYPWDGKVTIHLEMEQPAVFGLKLRIPGWCRQARLQVKREAIDILDKLEKGYVRLNRKWSDGDKIELNLSMPVERVHAHPDVRQVAGCVALQRGPLVYCLEEVDNITPLHRIVLPRDVKFKSHFDKNLLGGVVVIKGNALTTYDSGWDNVLYRAQGLVTKPCNIFAIPYYAWDNRRPGKMSIWVREEFQKM